jgi:hypothetical protein
LSLILVPSSTTSAWTLSLTTLLLSKTGPLVYSLVLCIAFSRFSTVD